ncbi:hypothetical protein ACQSSU_25105 [Micromonospora echinospora]
MEAVVQRLDPHVEWLARDYGRKPAHAEAMIKVAMVRLMAACLAGEDIEPQGPIETETARRLGDKVNQK